MARRQNTFRIDFVNAPKKPTYEELHIFVADVLGLEYHEVNRIQCSRTLGCAFVKVPDLELAQKVCAEHDKKHVIEIDGKAYTVRVNMEDGAVEVKLYDLSEDITEKQINDFLCAYGDVVSIREQMWEDKYRFRELPTGVWIARMIVKRNIPSFVNIDGETTYLSYYGQHQTCRHCGESVHNGASCVQNKKLLIQKMTADSNSVKSYANVTKQPPAASTSHKNKPPGTTGNKQYTLTPKNPEQQVSKPKNHTTLFKKPQACTIQQQQPQQHQEQEQPQQEQQQEQQEDQQQQRSRLPRTCKNNNGDETDDSIASNNSKRSRRPHEKKPRYDDRDISQDEDVIC